MVDLINKSKAFNSFENKNQNSSHSWLGHNVFWKGVAQTNTGNLTVFVKLGPHCPPTKQTNTQYV